MVKNKGAVLHGSFVLWNLLESLEFYLSILYSKTKRNIYLCKKDYRKELDRNEKEKKYSFNDMYAPMLSLRL